MKFLKTYEDKILDKILDKMFASGKDSLSPLEKEYLDKFSKGQSTKDVQQEMNKKEYIDEIGPYDAKLVLTNVEDVDNYDEPNYGAHQRWNGTLYIGDKEYEGYIGFKGVDYLYGYFENIYEELEGFHYEIDQFCENAFYSLQGLIGITENFFLSESRVSDITDKYSKIIDSNIIEYFKKHDPTANNAYFEWMCDRYSKLTEEEKKKFKSDIPELIIKMIHKYHRIKTKISEKQINRIQTISELGEILNQDRNWSELKKLTGANILYESYEWIVFIPYKWEISEKFGDKSWCTVYQAEEHFPKHFGEYGALIYFMNKLDGDYNFALEQTSNAFDVWDSKDNKIVEDEDYTMIPNIIIDEFGLKKHNEIFTEWNNIIEKIPVAKMTETKYRHFVGKKMKEQGIEWIAKRYGDTPIIESIEVGGRYKEIMQEVIDKLIKNIMNDTTIVDEEEFFENFPESYYNEVLIKIHPVHRNKEYKKDVLYDYGVKKTLEALSEKSRKFILTDYINNFYDGTGHLEQKLKDAFDIGRDQTIYGEAAELIEKYINWDILMSYLIQEMDEEDYFEWIEEI